MGRRVVRRQVTAWTPERTVVRPDSLAGEEPLEIRLDGRPFTVTMRTPGDDVDLVLGFLVSEGVVRQPEDVRTAQFCAGATDGGLNTYNVLDVTLGETASATRPERHVLTTSACGLCGRTSIDEVRTSAPYDLRTDTTTLDARWLASLPARLQTAQQVFASTGGLHGAALFAAGADEPLVVREDVGRHNAVDKCIGRAHREGLLPLRGTVLVVSGRASFELVQKAVVAGATALVAVSAPSSLAVELADETGLTLAAFARGDRMNLYTGLSRLAAAAP